MTERSQRSETPSLSAFVDRKGPSEWSVQLLNPTCPEPMEEMVADLFKSLNAEFSEARADGVQNDMLVLTQDSAVVASSPLERVRDTLLMVNSDLYSTGTKGLGDINVPDVIAEFTDTVFTLSGYPKSNTEKLVLTLLSRGVERQALRARTGTLRSSFQQLSLLDDEQGTREVYERLGRLSELDTHVYGIPDWVPPPEMGLAVHRVRDDEIRDAWFVVHRSGAGTDMAMLAIEGEPNVWSGYWTRNPAEVRAIDDYVSRTF